MNKSARRFLAFIILLASFQSCLDCRNQAPAQVVQQSNNIQPHPAVFKVRRKANGRGFYEGSCTCIVNDNTLGISVWMTAAHVVADGVGLCEIYKDGNGTPAEFSIYRDPNMDVAVMVAGFMPTAQPMAIWTDTVKPGMPVWGEGFGGDQFGRTRGKVENNNFTHDYSYDLPSIPGDSGGVIYTMYQGYPFWVGPISGSNYKEPYDPPFTVTSKLELIKNWMFRTSYHSRLGKVTLGLQANGFVTAQVNNQTAKFDPTCLRCRLPIIGRVLGGRNHVAPWQQQCLPGQACYPQQQQYQQQPQSYGQGLIPTDPQVYEQIPEFNPIQPQPPQIAPQQPIQPQQQVYPQPLPQTPQQPNAGCIGCPGCPYCNPKPPQQSQVQIPANLSVSVDLDALADKLATHPTLQPRHGRDGKDGERGPAGRDGVDGMPGRDGKDATVTEDQLAAIVQVLEGRLANNPNLRGPKGERGEAGIAGPPGPAGPQGNEASVDTDALADRIVKNLNLPVEIFNPRTGDVNFSGNLTAEGIRIPFDPGDTPVLGDVRRHLVIVRDPNAAYWPVMSQTLTRAQQHYSGIKEADPPPFATELPQIVGYRDGSPKTLAVGQREVSALLASIVNGTFDQAF